MINSQLQWLLDLRDNHNCYSKAGQIVIEVQKHTHIYIFFNSLYMYIYNLYIVNLSLILHVKHF